MPIAKEEGLSPEGKMEKAKSRKAELACFLSIRLHSCSDSSAHVRSSRVTKSTSRPHPDQINPQLINHQPLWSPFSNFMFGSCPHYPFASPELRLEYMSSPIRISFKVLAKFESIALFLSAFCWSHSNRSTKSASPKPQASNYPNIPTLCKLRLRLYLRNLTGREINPHPLEIDS